MLILFFILNAIALSSSAIILTPLQTNSTNQDVGIIVAPGASIEAKSYRLFFETLQTKYSGQLWVAILEFPLSLPNPLQINGKVNEALTEMKNIGFKYTKETPFFFVGHSLGGVIIQDFLYNESNLDKLPVKMAGLILEGSYVNRKNYELSKDPSLVPAVASFSGELDGLNRISRMAESFYFDLKNVGKGVERMTYLIPGMNHYQFAGEGNPPYLVRNNDITPTISNQQARDQTTELMAAFIKATLNISNDKDVSLLSNAVTTTAQLANPLLQAFTEEGSYHFNTPCYTLDKPEGSGCTQGSPWTEISQKLMGGPNATMQVTDSFHPVYQINPVHLPDIHNKCETPFACTLNVTTVSQLLYSYTDSQDVSMFSTAASEIKMKLMSRQSVLLKATGKVYDLKETDGGNKCADINQFTINWAMSKAPKQVLERYLASNRQLRVGDDIGPLNVGPLWIWTALKFNDKVDSKGQSYVEIQSPMMNTPVDYPIAAARGFHYCKVLSPARALEWMYVDSIKP